MTLEYITTRELENNGKIRILKVKEEPEADVELTCPECGKVEKRKEKWAEPFITGTGASQKFSLSCNSCGAQVKLLRLKKELKKK